MWCSLKLWRVTDSTHIQTIGHAGRITCVTFSRDSRYVVTGSEDMSLKVWEADTGKLTQVLAFFSFSFLYCQQMSERIRRYI